MSQLEAGQATLPNLRDFPPPERFPLKSRVSIYFFINSSTADVIAFTPVRRVGSGRGANSGE